MFTRVKRIKGREYIYKEERYRDGGKVKSRSIYIGPAGGAGRRRGSDGGGGGNGGGGTDHAREVALRSAERHAEQVETYQREMFGETATERQAREAKEREFSQDKFLAQTETQSTDSAKENVESEAQSQKGDGEAGEDGQAV